MDQIRDTIGRGLYMLVNTLCMVGYLMLYPFMSQLNIYTIGKMTFKKQNLEHKCILQERILENRETLAEIYSTCQERSLRWRLV